MQDLWRKRELALDEGALAGQARPAASQISPHCVILFVGSNKGLAHRLGRSLARGGYALRTAVDGARALATLQNDRPDGVMLDFADAAAPSGTALLLRIRDIDATIPVIAAVASMEGRGTLIVDAIRAGAILLPSPVDPEGVHAAFQRAFDEQHRADTLAYYRMREAKRAGLEQLLGESIPMLRLKTQLRRLLDTETRSGEAPAVLLQGDSGTGKAEVARALHFDGVRRDRPFVRVDAEDLAASDAETRLFGHERSADAPERRLGLVEAADGGTLFISDLGSTAPPLQSRLVRLLEQGTLQRVGGSREVPVDVRVIAAMRCAPAALLRDGRLRPELHQRLANVPLQLVPLRERGDDMWLLTHCFVKGAAEHRGLAPPHLSGAARDVMALHRWPGNVRELRHTLERAVLMQLDGTIDSAHLEFTSAQRSAALPTPSELNLRSLEREALVRALQRAYGNVSQAARLLGISRDTMRYRMARHALGEPRAMR